jgi:23S rRNA (adenine1618-N6)-methyltransferase
MNNPKAGLHPENIHRFGYDFDLLVRNYPGLRKFVKPNPYGNISIDFADPSAVVALNKALLLTYYGIKNWKIPAGNLCPPIPGRADYLYHIKDLFGIKGDKNLPQLKGMDIGTGASGIYTLIGASLFGWKFICTDIDKKSITNVKSIVSANPTISGLIDCRLQQHASLIFKNVWKLDEKLDFTICNPPFHASAKDAAQATGRKNKNLELKSKVLNFGGKSNELWCPGGEKRFVSKMIQESVIFQGHCKWFTTLISKKESLPPLIKKLDEVKANHQIIEMAQGQKKSRILAWRF